MLAGCRAAAHPVKRPAADSTEQQSTFASGARDFKARAWVLRGWRKCVAGYVQGRSEKTEPAECGGMNASFSHRNAGRNLRSYEHCNPLHVCAESGIRFRADEVNLMLPRWTLSGAANVRRSDWPGHTRSGKTNNWSEHVCVSAHGAFSL